MNSTLIVEVAIGLVMMYLVVSLFCTIVQEWIAQLFSWRARSLEAAVLHLLNDSRSSDHANTSTPTTEAQKVLEHPLFKMLAPGSGTGTTPSGDKPSSKLSDKPSYVTSTNFALALIDVLGPARDDKGQITLQTLQASINGIESNPRLKKSLQLIVDTAENELSAAISGIERWFDSGMDRASGWYRRYVKCCLLAIAAVLVLLTNADSVQVALRLSADSGLRSAVAAYAATVAPPEVRTEGQQPPGSPRTDEQKKRDEQQKERLQKIQNDLAANLEKRDYVTGFGGLPVGWAHCYVKGSFSLTSCWTASYPGDSLTDPSIAFLVKIGGLFATVLSASLGAPFWFGLLQKLNAARATGPKPPSSVSGGGATS